MPHLNRQNPDVYTSVEDGHKKDGQVWKTLGKGGTASNPDHWHVASEEDIAILEGVTTATKGTFEEGQDIFGYDPDKGTPRAGLVPNWFRGKGAAGEFLGGTDVSGLSAKVRAAMDAFHAGYKHYEFEVIGGTGSRAGYVSWQVLGAEGPADQTWTIYEADDGGLYMYDKEVGMSSMETIVTPTAVTPTGPGVKEIKNEDGSPTSITNADGSVTKFYSVTDESGRTSIQKVTEPAAREAPKESDIITFDDAKGGDRKSVV